MRTATVYVVLEAKVVVMVVNELSQSEDAEKRRLSYDDNSLIFVFLLIQMVEKLQRLFVTVVVPSVYVCETVGLSLASRFVCALQFNSKPYI